MVRPPALAGAPDVDRDPGLVGDRVLRIRPAGAGERIGYRSLSAYQLKILQETLTLCAFTGFAALWPGEGIQPRYLVSFGLILAAVAVAIRRAPP